MPYYFCFLEYCEILPSCVSQTGKTINEEETLEKKLEGVMNELSSVEEEVRRYEERQEKQEKARGYIHRLPLSSYPSPVIHHHGTERFN